MDNRQYMRKELNLGIQMKLNDLEILCSIENMSDGGALAQIDPTFNKLISENSIGEEITFSVGYAAFSDRNFRGQIVRFIEEDNKKYIAIYFQ